MTKKLCVIGLGYIGLPTSAIFAKNGWQVIGVDINSSAVNSLNNGKVHIKENDLDELVEDLVVNKKFKASTKPAKADVFILAVSTPHHDNYTADLTNVKNAVSSIIPVLEKGNTIILESTVPPRTTRDIIAPILKNAGFQPGEDVYLAYCPERVLPGRILKELVENNRIVGGINSLSAKKAADVYRTFVKGKIIETTTESAEMSKLMENTYRDVNIALANELTKISKELQINTLDVIELANEHPRVNIHQPGPGVGGHCIAVDPYFIIEKDYVNTNLIKCARSINESMPKYIVNQIKILKDEPAKIAVFGLTYKGNIDDVRNSPSFEIIELLEKENYVVNAYDPYVNQEQVNFKLETFEETLKYADIMLILTDHDEFKTINWNKAGELMRGNIIIDTKNCVKTIDRKFNYFNYNNLYKIQEQVLIRMN